ncbi:MAG: cytochrome c biogenesis protein CcdA [Chloroflexi bacterium]|nr:cytochrome c biogenesis protein CcdA [Chloroflexota bacterium]
MSESLPSLGWAVAFLAGVISFFSPCVAPLVPGYVAYLAGASLDRPAPLGRVLATSLLFVLGFSFVFVALGMAAGLVGTTLDGLRPLLSRLAGGVLVLLGLVLVGLGPRMLQQEWRLQLAREALGPAEPVLLGMAFGFGWTPCVGPVLAAVLFYAGTRETVGQAGLLLLAYSVGLGVPFVAAGLGLSRLFGAWRAVRRLSLPLHLLAGATLIVVGALFLTDRGYLLALLTSRLLALVPRGVGG